MRAHVIHAFKVTVIEEQVRDVRVYLTNEAQNRYLLEARDIIDLPPGKYRVRGEVQFGDRIMVIDETITIGDV